MRFLWIGSQNLVELGITIKQDARKLGLDAEFVLLGELPAPHGVIALADIFCLTSREDPFPLVMLEAGYLGKPVVCFEGAGGAGEYCAHGGGIAVPYVDVDAMASACVDLLNDPERSARIGAAGAAAVRERFVVPAMAPQLWADICGFLATPPPPSVFCARGSSYAEIYRSWDEASAPRREYIHAHLERQEVRARAREMLREGKRKEAVKALLATLAGGRDGDPHVMVEALAEIGSDLAAVDPGISRVLLEQSAAIAGKCGLKADRFMPPRAIGEPPTGSR